jgi:ABC-type branched-subunit amino acid transport system substrate-binding protein
MPRSSLRTLTLALIALLLAACAPAPGTTANPTRTAAAPSATATPQPTPTPQGGPDLSGEIIAIYHLCDASGDLAAFNFAHIWAAQDLVAAINAAGGVFGAELELNFMDTGGTPEGAQSAYARLTARRELPALIIVCDAATELALAPLVEDDDIPTLGPGLAPQSYYTDPGGALFAYRVPVDVQFSGWLNYLVANWDAIKPQGAGDPIRLAVVGWPGEQGGALEIEAAEEYAAGLGIEIVLATEIEAQRNANVYDFLFAARDANANAIYASTRAFGTAELLNGLNALGLAERFVFAGPDFAFDGLDAYLLDPANLGGAFFTSSQAAWSQNDNAGIQFASELFVENEREDADHAQGYLATLAAVDLARHVIELALLEDEIEDLDAAALRSILRELDGYLVLEGLYVAGFAPSLRYPLLVQTYRVDPGSGQPVLQQDFSP